MTCIYKLKIVNQMMNDFFQYHIIMIRHELFNLAFQLSKIYNPGVKQYLSDLF